jgi:hypothetical protein
MTKPAHALAVLTLGTALLLAAPPALAQGGGGGGGGGGTTTTPPPNAAPCATVEVNNPAVTVNSKASVTLTWKVSSCSAGDEVVRGVLTGTCYGYGPDGQLGRIPTVTQTGPSLMIKSRSAQSFSLQLASNVNCPAFPGQPFSYLMTIWDSTGTVVLATVVNNVNITPGF